MGRFAFVRKPKEISAYDLLVIEFSKMSILCAFQIWQPSPPRQHPFTSIYSYVPAPPPLPAAHEEMAPPPADEADEFAEFDHLYPAPRLYNNNDSDEEAEKENLAPKKWKLNKRKQSHPIKKTVSIKQISVSGF
jgi:hypothetical protein